MTDARPLKLGNAQGFWGDDPGAPARLVAQQADLDYLTLDYLAEVSMSILAKQRDRDAKLGYARDFLDVVASLAPFWRAGRSFKVVTNAGGLNPEACARAAAEVLRANGCGRLRIATVSGDDVLGELKAEDIRVVAGASEPGVRKGSFSNLDSGAPLSNVAGRMVTANAYLGAAPIVEALSKGADLVITGRTADPSLTVGPAAHHFGWRGDDYDRLAGATVAGHLIECGAQVTGGISTDWLTVPDAANIGFPVVEIAADGSCVVTKPDGTGGQVDFRTVKEQLLYEIGDPGNYLSPDATVNFLTLRLSDDGPDRVRVAGATGGPPPETYKVSATYRAGYRAAGTLTIVGRDAVAKAWRCGEIVRERLRAAGIEPEGYVVECLGAGDVARTHGTSSAGVRRGEDCATEVVLRIAVADARREVVERFARAMTPLITAGPQGTTGYAEGRPQVREVFGYWPTLIPRGSVRPRVEVFGVGE